MYKKNNIDYVNLTDAKKVVYKWNGKPETIKFLGNSGNSVFKFKNKSNNWHILRFTDIKYRKISYIKAELEFLEFLKVNNVNVSYSESV